MPAGEGSFSLANFCENIASENDPHPEGSF